MPIAVRAVLVVLAGLWVAGALAAGAMAAEAPSDTPRVTDARKASDAPQPAAGSETPAAPDVYRHLKPLVVEQNDLRPFTGGKSDQPSRPAESDDAPPIAMDAVSHTVRIPVRPTGAKGVVEWLLAASGKHPGLAVLVTDCPARAVAAAMVKAELKGGAHPVPVAEDATRAPTGSALRLALVARGADGQTVRVPAERLIAATSDGKPVAAGRWVYAGPATLDDGKVLLSGLSGSVATTNLRDASAMIYWVPDRPNGGVHYVKAYYARPGMVPAEASDWVLEIRPAEPPPAEP